jgi:hypothetical protein
MMRSLEQQEIFLGLVAPRKRAMNVLDLVVELLVAIELTYPAGHVARAGTCCTNELRIDKTPRRVDLTPLPCQRTTVQKAAIGLRSLLLSACLNISTVFRIQRKCRPGKNEVTSTKPNYKNLFRIFSNDQITTKLMLWYFLFSTITWT